MATRTPLSWLVITTARDASDQNIALLGRAVFDVAADLVTVTTPDGQREVTQVGGHPVQELAKLLLFELFTKKKNQEPDQ